MKDELGTIINDKKLNSNLTNIVNILSQTDLNNISSDINKISYEIDEKIEYNQLNTTNDIIKDYCIHHNLLKNIYEEYDKNGVNKSYSVFHTIRNEYIKLRTELKDNDSDEIFLSIISNVKNIITHSKNFTEITMEELDLCVNIIVVDAFICCKIFKNPENIKNVTS